MCTIRFRRFDQNPSYEICERVSGREMFFDSVQICFRDEQMKSVSKGTQKMVQFSVPISG